MKRGAKYGKRRSVSDGRPLAGKASSGIDRSIHCRFLFIAEPRSRSFMKRLAALYFLCALSLFSQINTGELRLKVTDPSGAALRSTVQIVSEANQYNRTLTTDEGGTLIVQRLPF